ncbi:MAG TPA: hypothetical protein VFA35_04495, partial [Burkholderiaceae bacterium]|nr:hypothetical protein [Burkholderiaceae bacterium]
DEVVAEVVGARQPDGAVEHGQFTAQAPEVSGVGPELEGSAMKQVELRIHHQSPAFGIAMISHITIGIQ